MILSSNTHNKKASFLSEIIIISFFFFSIYNVNFIFLPVNTALIQVLIGIVILYLLAMMRKIEISFTSEFLMITMLFFLLMAWILFRTLSTSFLDTGFVNIGIRIIFQAIPSSICAIYLIKKRKNTMSEIVKYIHFVILMQGVFIILTFLSTDFRMFSNQIIPEAGNIAATSIYRVRGISNSTGAHLSTIQALGLFFSCHLLMDKNKGKRKKQFYIFSIPVLIISIALTGNSGFLMIGFIFLYFLIIHIKKGSFSIKLISRIVNILIVFGIVALSFNLLYSRFGVNEMPWGEDALQRVIRNITDEFSTNNDSILPRTVGVLFEKHYHLPEDTKTFIIGNPLTWNHERINSDVGYIRNIYGIGIFGSIIAYSGFIVLLTKTKKRTNSIEEKTLITILMLWLLFIEMKEPFILRPYYVFVYFTFFSYYNVNFKRKGIKRSEIL